MAETAQNIVRIQLGEAKRRYSAHFVSKLSDSDGEQNETRHWLKSAMSCGYISEEMHNELLEKCRAIGRMLGNMMKNAERWIPKECI